MGVAAGERGREPTSERVPSRRSPVGCAAVLVAALGIVLGAGLWLGKRDEESLTRCQRYARTVVRALDHCYSGKTREHRHHIGECERSIDPPEACLERIQVLPCEELERGPAAAAAGVCLRQPARTGARQPAGPQ
jgi:hypothetical protein